MTEPRDLRIVSLPQLEQCSSQRATVIGTYHEIDVRMKQREPVKYVGHSAVTLDDGTDVYLEPVWSSVALRASSERRQFNGRRVAVTGIVFSEMPQPPEPVAHPIAPCVSNIERIELVAV